MRISQQSLDEMEKQLSDLVADCEWHRKKWHEKEARILALKEFIVFCKGENK